MFDGSEELLRKIQLREETSLELKLVSIGGNRVSAPKRNDLADEIAAIANTHDGVLVLGVDDKTRNVTGIAIEDLEIIERFVFEICNESIKPPVVFHSFRIELPDNSGKLKPVLKIEIPRSLYVHKSPGGYWHRQGSSKRELSPDLLARLFQQRSQALLIRFDEQPVPETSFASFDENLRRRFLSPRIADDEASFKKMKLLTEDSEGQARATVAGILMCSLTPDKWLPGGYIQAVCYRGKKQDSNFQLDAKDIRGPVDQQVREALTFVRRNMKVAARKEPARVEFPQFSMRAVFEAIVNAVAHRDYSVYGSKIRLFLFDDRLELFSPGPLPNTVTIETMPLRQLTRNELLTTLLARCPVEGPANELDREFLMEKRGDGIPIILEESEKLSGKLPEFRLLDDAELRLTIYAADVASD